MHKLSKSNSSYNNIYVVVRQIPHGHVVTYGQVAELAGIPGQARQVGYALSALHDTDVPWHRVVNAKGQISHRSNSDYEKFQQDLLESEGIEFNQDGSIPLKLYRWRPL